MRSRLAPALALALVAATAVADGDAPPPELVERVLAVVDERPLLLSSVRVVEEVRGLEPARALEEMIDERLMLQEAARLPQAAVTGEEEERALESLLLTRPGLVERVPRADLRRLLSGQLAILKYIDFRFRPQIRITDEALREAWNEGFGGVPEGPPFEEAAPGLRARLERGELDRRIEDWVKDLRGRARIRYVEGPGFAPVTASDVPEGP